MLEAHRGHADPKPRLNCSISGWSEQSYVRMLAMTMFLAARYLSPQRHRNSARELHRLKLAHRRVSLLMPNGA
jgi:hypothetical protein